MLPLMNSEVALTNNGRISDLLWLGMQFTSGTLLRESDY
jgi:hypothetical protein